MNGFTSHIQVIVSHGIIQTKLYFLIIEIILLLFSMNAIQLMELSGFNQVIHGQHYLLLPGLNGLLPGMLEIQP